jgi:Mu transposase, C-terminal
MESNRLVSAAGVSFKGKTFCSGQLFNMQGKKVTVSVDPLSPGIASVYDLDGRFLCAAKCHN